MLDLNTKQNIKFIFGLRQGFLNKGHISFKERRDIVRSEIKKSRTLNRFDKLLAKLSFAAYQGFFMKGKLSFRKRRGIVLAIIESKKNKPSSEYVVYEFNDGIFNNDPILNPINSPVPGNVAYRYDR